MAELRRQTLGGQILEIVMKRIIDGGYKVGDMLPNEKQLAAELSVSRGSVREALKALNLAGVTESIAGKGTFLLVEPSHVPASVEKLRETVMGVKLSELIEAREIIEVEAAALAAVRATDDDIDKIKLACENLMEALDKGVASEVSEAGHVFHLSIVQSCGNSLLLKLLEPVMYDIRHARSLVPIDWHSKTVENNIHARITDAIIARDPVAARVRMTEHFVKTRKQAAL